MDTIISHSPQETEFIGEEWGRNAASGWVIGLSGDLGAGKTQLVRGIARGLGNFGRVHSPTFALINEYHGGRLPLFHLDLYRLEGRNEIIAAGLEEYFYEPQGVSVIEWIERWGMPEKRKRPLSQESIFRSVTIEAISETGRRIVYEDFSH